MPVASNPSIQKLPTHTGAGSRVLLTFTERPHTPRRHHGPHINTGVQSGVHLVCTLINSGMKMSTALGKKAHSYKPIPASEEVCGVNET
jgi:hypothetical protein